MAPRHKLAPMESRTIETERLVLRPHRLDDFDAMAALWREPEIVRYISGKPSTREQSWMRLLRYAGHWSLLGYGYWAIEERESGAFAGECGFADFHRDIDPPLDGMPEMGWMVSPRFQGKGYATEAIVGCLAWGAEHLPAGMSFACIITPDNLASIRVAEKCGFRLREETTYLGDAVGLYTRNAG